MSFDPLQRECLEAMGFTVLALASRPGVEAASPGVVPTPAPERPDRLLQALVRAAGRDPADPVALETCRSLLPPGGLRDARARRALWPRLRALRARAARG
ncbi:hypothetical protein [Luteimonas wenzhouensis]|jgi:hypothetical protein|uniref:hypothetical protein n=1 Tax=Luteimonas wenzhouensis TaxID=2599615 RepID=UPI001FE8CD71|nr:hypothetical protein [Luteimonas wenzhouensis]